MIDRDDFTIKITKMAHKIGDPTLVQEMSADLDEHWQELQVACNEVIRKFPSIGFCSRDRRLNAFYVACEVLEDLQNKGDIDDKGAMTCIVILRTCFNPFNKAVSMFDTMADARRVNKNLIPNIAYIYAKSADTSF